MDGTKELYSSSNGENHPSPSQEHHLGLGFQKPTSPNPSDSTLDPPDELNRVLQTLALKDSVKKEEVLAESKQPTGEEEDHQLEQLKEEYSNLVIGEEIAANNAPSDEVHGQEVSGFINEASEESQDTKGNGENDEEDDCEVEIEPKKCSVEENEGQDKGMEEGSANEHGSKLSEVQNEERNDNIIVKEGQGVVDNYDNWGGTEDGEEDNGGRIEAKEEQGVFGNFENNWNGTENWEVSGGKIEGKEEKRVFGNYEDERCESEQDDEGSNGYGNAEGDSVGLKDGNYGSHHQYPLRPDAEDCSFYMRMGACKFGSNCKFNHPLRRRNQAATEPFKKREENSDRHVLTECKYYSTSVGCKFGKACRFSHARGKTVVAPILEFNFLGLPIRLGEKECPYYMRTGSCKYGSNCRFNHPDPTAVGGGGGDPLSGYVDSSVKSNSKDTISGWSSARSSNEAAPFVPALVYPPTPVAPPNSEWNGYQAPLYPTSESSLPTPPAFAMNNIPATDPTNYYAPHHQQQQMIVEEFPERPGQPECSFFMRTGDCKYKSGCKFHHPKNRIPKSSPSFAFSDQGLPLRPDQNICTHYSRYGICKFGPACKYNHPATHGSNSALSAGSGPDQPQYGNSATAREW